MRYQYRAVLLTLGLVALAPLSACMKENLSCEERGYEPGCDSPSGGAAGAGGTSSTKGGSSAPGGSATRGGTSAGGPSTTTTAPCNRQCSGATPLCDESKDRCVACLESTDCKDAAKPVCSPLTQGCVGCLASADCTKDATKPLCDLAKTTCVGCMGNTDCTDATASRCDHPTNVCSACQTDNDCSQIAAKNVCSGGVCVQCTTDKETACGTNSCNPKTKVCTVTARGSRKTCQACVADSECGDSSGVVDPNKRCVPMSFNGTPHGEGGYCLLRRASQPCVQPYTVLFTTESLSGAVAELYCGVNQTTTTCEAILDLFNTKACALDTECGGGAGGMCKESLSTGTFSCTIPCGLNSECPGSLACSDTTNGWCT